MERLDQFLTRWEQADNQFSRTVIRIIGLFDKRMVTDDHLRMAKLLWVNNVPSFDCLPGEDGVAGPTPVMSHGRLSISETRAVIGCACPEVWFDKSACPMAVVAMTIKFMVGPHVLGSPARPLRIITTDELECFFTANPDASDEDALDWINDQVQDY